MGMDWMNKIVYVWYEKIQMVLGGRAPGIEAPQTTRYSPALQTTSVE